MGDFILGRLDFVGFVINSGVKTAALFTMAAALSFGLRSSAARTRRQIWHLSFSVAVIAVVVSYFFTGTTLMSLQFGAGPFGIPIYQASRSSIPLAVWLVGVVASLAWLVPSLLHRRAIERSSLPDKAWLSRLVGFQSRKLEVGKECTVLVGTTGESPMTWGVRRPIIFLPQWVTELSTDEQSQIVTHELEHVRSHDNVHRLLARAACAFLWFNPLCWFALRQLIAEQELAADEAVLGVGESAVGYAATLIFDLRIAKVVAQPMLAIPFVGTSQFGARIRSLLSPGASKRPPILGTATLAAAVAASGIALGSVRLVLQVDFLTSGLPAEALGEMAELETQNLKTVFEVAR
jgi:hypothetical protein